MYTITRKRSNMVSISTSPVVLSRVSLNRQPRVLVEHVSPSIKCKHGNNLNFQLNTKDENFKYTQKVYCKGLIEKKKTKIKRKIMILN